MDHQRFDDVAKLIGTGASRRRILTGLAGAVLSLGARGHAAAGTCAGAGEACVDGLDSSCCTDAYCVFQDCVAIPVCAPLYCSSRVDCCDNKICLDGGGNLPSGDFSGGSCYVREGDLCDGNGDQGCQTGECIDGYCGGPPVSDCTADGDCGDDLICCGYGGGGAGCVAQECCGPDDTDHCGNDEVCSATNTCVAAVQCAAAGVQCATIEQGFLPCCDGLVCNEESGLCEAVSATECDTDGDCVQPSSGTGADAICCAGFCREIECCIDDEDPNARCPDGTSCFEGSCDAVDTSGEEPEPEVPVTLPSTGVGGEDGLNPLLGVSIVAGAAALLAGKRLRRANDQP